MKWQLALGSITSVAVVLLAVPAAVRADDPSPPVYPNTNLQAVSAIDQQPGSSSATPAGAGGTGGTGLDYDFGPSCGLGGQAICYAGALCVSDGTEGVLYDIFLTGEKVGEVCVTEPQAATPQEQVTPGRVLRAFRSLTWPQSDLSIQPAGKTLVNFETNFYTDNSAPSRQSVTLLNQDVLIEATPTTYTWRFGDGDALDTSIPGSAYPALDITHSYVTADSFGPSLDTTYSGRYRLNGGPWITIPETLTVTGAPQSLQSVEARPTLVEH